MATLEQLIAELRAGGELDSRGEFTLDRDRAREKMRQFQLTDPRSYVLELVQAAVLAGATEARFEIDADDMRMSFDGRPFTTRDFEELYSSMFTRRSSPARRQLALGLNSAMALEPRILRVESGTTRMEMRSGSDQITTEKETVDGTRIHVKDRFSNATLVRFVLKLRGHITEMLYLKERCRYAALPIYLNGQRISGDEPLAETYGQIEWSTRVTSIFAGFTRQDQPAQLAILDQGVWIATHQLDHLPSRFVASVESARLIKDASQRDVVRNAAYEEVLKAVSEAFYRALAQLAREGHSGEKLFRRRLFHPSTLPLIRRTIDALQESRDDTAEGRTVTAVRLWPAARQPPLNLSLLELLKLRASHGRVGWTDEGWPDLKRKDQPPVVVISTPEERNYLEELLGDGFYRADSELQRELTRWRNILRWRHRRMTPEIPASSGSLISVPLTTPEVQGEVGIFLDPIRQSQGPGRFPVWWIKEGGLLEKAVATPIVRGFTTALEADFEPTEDFARVEVDRLFVRVAVAVARALGPLMNRLASEPRRIPGLKGLIRGCLISYLSIDWNRGGLAQHLTGFGVTDEEHFSYAQRLIEDDPVATLSAADLVNEDAPVWAGLPLFHTVQGRQLSLRDVAQGGESWRYIPKPRSGAIDVQGQQTSAEDDVLLLEEDELAVLRQVFPGITLQDHSRDYYYPAAYARHMRQGTPKPHVGCLEEVAIEAGDIQGRVGLRYPRSPGTPAFAEIQLLKHERRLDNIRFRLPLGPITGMVNDDELTPTPNWSGVEHDDAIERIRSLVLEHITGLLVDLCGSPLLSGGYRRRLLLDAATRVLATRASLAHWSVSELLPPEVADSDWAARLAEALETVPLFTDLDERGVDLREIRQELDRYDSLVYLLDLQGVLAVSGDTNPQEVLRLAGGRLVLRLSPDDQAALAQIVGSYRLSNARDWIVTGRWVEERAALPVADPVEPFVEGENLEEVSLSSDALGSEVTPPDEPGEPDFELALAWGESDRADSRAPSPQTPVAVADVERLEHDEQQAILPAQPSSPGGPGPEESPEMHSATAESTVPDSRQSREARLLQTLHTELRNASRDHVQLLDDKNLDRIALGDLGEEAIASSHAHGVIVNRRQALVERLLAEPEIDPVRMAFLASAVYTAMNCFWQEIEDDHEREFHGALIQRLVDQQPRNADAQA